MRIIQKQYLNYESSRALLFEVRNRSQLDHPNLLKILDAYQDDQNVYVVEEAFDGLQLFDMILKKGVFTESDAVKVMHEVMLAVAYCHSQNVVNRDITPENILVKLDEKNEIVQTKLTGFFYGANCFKKDLLK